ncbi:MAG: hypothetical protein ABW023_12670 [Sphingomonas sp.]
MDIASVTGARSNAAASAPKADAAASDFASILDNFRKAAFETPAERARDQVLKKHNLSEADYQKLPAKERDSIDREVAEAVKKVTEAKTGVMPSSSQFSADKLLG